MLLTHHQGSEKCEGKAKSYFTLAYHLICFDIYRIIHQLTFHTLSVDTLEKHCSTAGEDLQHSSNYHCLETMTFFLHYKQLYQTLISGFNIHGVNYFNRSLENYTPNVAGYIGNWRMDLEQCSTISPVIPGFCMYLHVLHACITSWCWYFVL